MRNSLVTGSFAFRNSKEEVMTAAIDTRTKLGRKGPDVDRLLGKVSGPIKKKQTPFFPCNAELTISEKAGTTTVFIAVMCVRDEEANKSYSVSAYRQITTWLLGRDKGLNLHV